jgi:RNA polymerase sigma-70 factor (ECF subfamily)
LHPTGGSGNGEVDRGDPIARAVADFQADIDRERSFKLLHDRFYKAVRNVFHGISIEDASDLTQETFLALYRGLKGFRGDAELSTWLFRIAKNIRFHWFRRQRAQADQESWAPAADEPTALDDHRPVAVDPDSSPAERAELEENLRWMREAIESLSPKMRECLEHRVYDDLKYQEIAERMQISIETVKAHMFQARNQLKARLGKRFGGIDF